MSGRPSFKENSNLYAKYEFHTNNQGKSLLQLHMPMEGKYEDSIKRQQIHNQYGIGKAGSDTASKVLPSALIGRTEQLKKSLNPAYDWTQSNYRQNAPKNLSDYLSDHQKQFRQSLDGANKAPMGGNLALFDSFKHYQQNQQNQNQNQNQNQSVVDDHYYDRSAQTSANFTRTANFGRIALKKQKSSKSIQLIPEQYRYYSA